jgi:Ni/Fe-hydrogenase subunit HybB-like protein
MRAIASKLTFWNVVLALVLLVGGYSIVYRLVYGLGASTNLSDQFPWGLWIGFDVLCGVGLAAGAFTLCAIVHIFNLERFKPIVRPAVLTGFLGYFLVAIAISLDIGRPWRIWHPLVFWNPDSVMFEVAWCVTLYLSVLALEFAPAVFERLRSPRALKMLKAISLPLVIAGVLLSMLHQSSVGSLYLIVPNKLHPLWYSPLLPVLFFVSAIAIGMAMVIVESNWSRRAFGHEIDVKLLGKLGQGIVVVMGTYGVLRIWDLHYRGSLGAVLVPSEESAMFLLEMLLMVVAPVALLAVRKVRETRLGLLAGGFTAVLGFIMNRLNVAITGMRAASGVDYRPAWMEWALTAGLVALGMLLFMLAVKYLPIFGPAGAKHATTPVSAPVVEGEVEPAAGRLAAPSAS